MREVSALLYLPGHRRARHRCESGLVSGTVTYEPEPLDDPAPGQVLLRRARPWGPVTVDL